jgi:uncharacterized protein
LNTHGESFDVVSETIKRMAFKITRVGQLIAVEASKILDTPFGVIDLSLAPTPVVAQHATHFWGQMVTPYKIRYTLPLNLNN